MKTIQILFRNLYAYARLDLTWFLRDTRYCLLQVVCDLICAACSVAGVFLLSIQFDGFGGMAQEEVLFMLGYSTMVDGVFFLFFIGNNTGHISRIIGRGQLDHCMIQPVPIWIQLFAQGFCPFSCSSMLMAGIGLTVYSIKRLGVPVSGGWILMMIISVISSTAIILAFTFIISCTAFYAPVAAEEISGVSLELFNSLKTYPLGGMPGIWQGLLCTILPIGLTAWYPSVVLLGGDVRFPAFTLIAASLLILGAALLFRKGMKYYAKNSSPRYSGFGHR